LIERVGVKSTTSLRSVPFGLITSIGTGGGGGETIGGIYIDKLNANNGNGYDWAYNPVMGDASLQKQGRHFLTKA
jgi:hypothetical protein